MTVSWRSWPMQLWGEPSQDLGRCVLDKRNMTLLFSRNTIRLEQRGKRDSIRKWPQIGSIVCAAPKECSTSDLSGYPITGLWPLFQTAHANCSGLLEKTSENTHEDEWRWFYKPWVQCLKWTFKPSHGSKIYLFGSYIGWLHSKCSFLNQFRTHFSHSHSAYMVV